MQDDTTAVPTGQLAELMMTAKRRESFRPEEIAEILDTDELPVRYEVSVSIGE